MYYHYGLYSSSQAFNGLMIGVGGAAVVYAAVSALRDDDLRSYNNYSYLSTFCICLCCYAC